MLIFKTIPTFAHVRWRACYGRGRPHENATLGLNLFILLLLNYVKWERYWNLAMLWDRPHVRTHRKTFDSVRQLSIAVDRGWRREFECYCNLLILDFWYRIVPHTRTLPKVMDSVRMPSTVDDVWTHANTCEGVSENAALILDCWPLHMAEHFGSVYRIVLYHDILCSIISYPSFSPMAISCHH